MNDEIKIGQELYIVPISNSVRSYGQDIRKGTVAKIGRKYLYVKIEGLYCGEDGIRFSKTTLCNESEYNPDWLAFRSMQEIHDREEANRLREEFREFFSWGGKNKELTLEQLRSIKTILERGKS